jgi:hypothetical protein
MIRSIDLAGLVVAAALAGPAAAQEAPAREAPAMLHLQLPVDCVIGSTCFVQHYVDEDPSEGARDYRCGTLTYDGHDGTDFRVPTLAAQKAGVDVLAAARGRVLRIRDGQPDQALAQFGRDAVKGSECGNGVVIAHAGGFETQYCHLAEDSVAVHPGDPVEAGQRIGRIGQSGLAEFPHLHLTLRKDGKPVDPFRSRATADCGGDLAYWDEAARRALSYSPGSVINRGFATGPVTMAEIEAGTAGAREPGGDAPALVAFIRAIGLRQGRRAGPDPHGSRREGAGREPGAASRPQQGAVDDVFRGAASGGRVAGRGLHGALPGLARGTTGPGKRIFSRSEVVT